MRLFKLVVLVMVFACVALTVLPQENSRKWSSCCSGGL